MRTVDQTPSLVPKYDVTVYLVLDDFGDSGPLIERPMKNSLTWKTHQQHASWGIQQSQSVTIALFSDTAELVLAAARVPPAYVPTCTPPCTLGAEMFHYLRSLIA
jgi:hypothetical protein